MPELDIVRDLRRDRRVWAYGRIGAAEFDETNRLGDSRLPGREDYSVAMNWTGLETAPSVDADLWPAELGAALESLGGEGPQTPEIFVAIVTADGLLPIEIRLAGVLGNDAARGVEAVLRSALGQDGPRTGETAL